jgi:hypothetical protein
MELGCADTLEMQQKEGLNPAYDTQVWTVTVGANSLDLYEDFAANTTVRMVDDGAYADVAKILNIHHGPYFSNHF